MTSAQGQSCACPISRVCCYSLFSPQSFFQSWFGSVRETCSLFCLYHSRIAASLTWETATQNLLSTFGTKGRGLLVKLWKLSIAVRWQRCALSRIYDREVQHEASSLCHQWMRPKMKMKITRSLSSMRGLLLWSLWSSDAQEIKAGQILSRSFK